MQIIGRHIVTFVLLLCLGCQKEDQISKQLPEGVYNLQIFDLVSTDSLHNPDIGMLQSRYYLKSLDANNYALYYVYESGGFERVVQCASASLKINQNEVILGDIQAISGVPYKPDSCIYGMRGDTSRVRILQVGFDQFNKITGRCSLYLSSKGFVKLIPYEGYFELVQ